MSISSSANTNSAIAHLLAGVASECSAIGTDIAHLGAALSGGAGRKGTDANIVRLQSFDRLMQNAHAQACLIAHVARVLLAGHELGETELARMIDNVPIHDARARLKRAVGCDHLISAEIADEIWKDGGTSEPVST